MLIAFCESINSAHKCRISCLSIEEPKLGNSKLPKTKLAIIGYFKKDQNEACCDLTKNCVSIPLLRMMQVVQNI